MNLPPEDTYNLTNELAKERNRAAAERTLMAWIRTSLSLISFGFGIDRIVVAIHKGFNHEIDPLHLSRILGLCFITIGTLALLGATLSHREDLRKISRGNFTYTPRISLSFVVAISLIAVGLFAFLGILIKG
jgi:putative membrane protein